MWATGQFHDPIALSPDKEAPLLHAEEAGWAR